MPYTKAYKLLYFIVLRFRKNFGRLPNRTELIKMLYLTDLEHYKKYGELYTEFKYIFYNYGPWTRQFHDLLDYMKTTEIKEIKKSPSEDHWFYESTGNKPRHDANLEPDVTEVLENTLFIYEESNLKQILKVVYTTEPMVSTPRGEVIDFGKLPLNARSKRLQYKESRKRSLEKLAKLENSVGDEDSELLDELKPYRKRANQLLWQEP